MYIALFKCYHDGVLVYVHLLHVYVSIVKAACDWLWFIITCFWWLSVYYKSTK